jgi:hypothetical protein
MGRRAQSIISTALLAISAALLVAVVVIYALFIGVAVSSGV